MTLRRRTPQRDAVRDAIQEAARPLGPNEILDAARRRVPGLGIATPRIPRGQFSRVVARPRVQEKRGWFCSSSEDGLSSRPAR